VEGLRGVGRAEGAVRARGFRELRVRHFGEAARVEIAPVEMGRLDEPSCREAVVAAVRAAGYATAEIDPEGYRRRRLNLRVVAPAGRALPASNGKHGLHPDALLGRFAL